MKIFIQAFDYDMWSIIVNGPHTPTKIIDDIKSIKFEREWDEIDKKMTQLNACRLRNLIVFQHTCRLKKYGIGQK